MVREEMTRPRESAETVRESACSQCGGAVTVERGGLGAHSTCLRCGHVAGKQERSMSLSQAILLFAARG